MIQQQITPEDTKECLKLLNIDDDEFKALQDLYQAHVIRRTDNNDIRGQYWLELTLNDTVFSMYYDGQKYIINDYAEFTMAINEKYHNQLENMSYNEAHDLFIQALDEFEYLNFYVDLIEGDENYFAVRLIAFLTSIDDLFNVYICLIQAEEWYKEKFSNIKLNCEDKN